MTLTVASLACAPELRTPPGAVVLCSHDADCAEDRRCHDTLGRCVPRRRTDERAPGIAAWRFEPPVGKAGTVFDIDVTFDEPLALPPTGEVDVGVAVRPLVGSGRNGDAYRFAYPAGGDELFGRLRFSALDAAGNAADIEPGSLAFDFEAPLLTMAWTDDASILGPASIAALEVFTEPEARLEAARAHIRLADGAEEPAGVEVLTASFGEGSGGTATTRILANVAVDELAGDVAAVTLELEVADAVGNLTTERAPWRPVDIAPPDTHIVATPPALDARMRAAFSFVSPDDAGASYECRLDGATWKPCASPFEEVVGDVGAHHFEVRAIDAAGNVDASPADHVWDTTRLWTERIATGTDHACAIASDDSLWCWGARFTDAGEIGGQLAPGNARPIRIGTDADWLDLAMHWGTTAHVLCGIRAGEGGSLWCWGSGWLALGEITSVRAAPSDTGTRGWAKLSTHPGCGIKRDGSLWCWGPNDFGAVGDGSLFTRTRPVQVGSATDWIAIDRSPGAACGIRGAGELWCWGTAVAVGDGSGAGSVAPVRVDGNADWFALKVSDQQRCGLRGRPGNASLWCWGAVDGAAEDVPVAMSADRDWRSLHGAGNLVVAGLSGHGACAAKTDGSLWCWDVPTAYVSRGLHGPSGITVTTPTPVDGADGASHYAVSAGVSCELRPDAALWCWGAARRYLGDDGADPTALAVASSLPGWQSVDAAAASVCGIVAGQLLCFGRGNLFLERREAYWTAPVRLTSFADWATIALGGSRACGIRDDAAGSRTSWCWIAGDAAATQLDIPEPIGAVGPETDWLQVEVADDGPWQWAHACGIRSDGGANSGWCWGHNQNGELGVRSSSSYFVDPTPIGGVFSPLLDWTDLALGDRHTCGTRRVGADSTLWCWGDDTYGQRGDGAATGDALSPVQIGADVDWLAVDASGLTTCGLRGAAPGSGLLCCWGRLHGAAGTLVDEPAPVLMDGAADWRWVEVGGVYACAGKADGAVWCWGDPKSGLPIQPAPVPQAGITSATGAAAGSTHRCAAVDTSLVCWGAEGDGLLGSRTAYGPVQVLPPR